MKTTSYLKLEKKIALDERGGVLDRWRYGRQLLDAKSGRQQLPHGLLAALLKADELAASGLATASDTWEEQQLDIPGLKPVISVRGRKIPVIKGEDGATIADVAAYLAMCVQMHENFGKTVEQIEASLKTMREHGDEGSNALEAWEAAIDDDMPTDEEPTA